MIKLNIREAMNLCDFIEESKKTEFINRVNNTKMETYLDEMVSEEDTIRKIRVKMDENYAYVYLISLSKESYSNYICKSSDGLRILGNPDENNLLLTLDDVAKMHLVPLDMAIEDVREYINTRWDITLTNNFTDYKLPCKVAGVTLKDNFMMEDGPLKYIDISELIVVAVQKNSNK